METMGFFRPSYATRAHNASYIAEGSACYRPESDAGYDELLERLLNRLSSDECVNPPMRPEPSMHMWLRKREFGHRIPSMTFQRGMQRAMILSKTRTYQFCETYEAEGLLSVFGPIMVSHRHRSVYNLELAKEICVLHMVRDDERIITSLFLEFPLENTVVPQAESPNWLISLTNKGRILVLNLRDGSLIAEFLLPINEARFSSMYPNEANRSFSVYGQMQPLERVFEPRKIPNAEYVIAMFNIHPLTFMGMFKMPKEIFGSVVNVNVIGEMVIVFRKKPHEVVIYELGDLRNRFTQQVFDPGEFADGKKELPFTVFITKEPQICSRIIGNWSTLEYSGSPYHFLGTPSNARIPFKLMDAAQRRSSDDIETPPGFCDRPVANKSLAIEDSPMFFLADDSGRLLRFEGPMLVSYQLRSHDGKMKVGEQWRTKIWVDEDFLQNSMQSGDTRSRSGRRITPAKDHDPDYRLAIKGVEYSPDLQVLFVAARCDLHSPAFDDPERPYDLVSRRNAYMDETDVCILAYILDAPTGKILKTSLMRSSCFEEVQFQLDTLDAGLTFLQRSRQVSVVEVQRLQELGVKEWENSERNVSCKEDFIPRIRSRSTRWRRNASSRGTGMVLRPRVNNVNNPGVPLRPLRSSTPRPVSPRRRRRVRRRLTAPNDEDSDDTDYVPSDEDNSD